MSRIAIIPARSGSKGLKDKNILPLNGKPLMAYTIECAIDSGVFDEVFVSTDSREYADIAKKYGADASFLRSERNSTDTAGSWDVVREVIEKFAGQGMMYEEVMLLQATSPLRNKEDILNSIKVMQQKNANAVISLTQTDHSPIWCNTLPDDGNMDNFDNSEYENMPRQRLPIYYRYNGAIYLVKTAELNKNKMFKSGCYAYVMPRERSVDIDTEFDFKVAELYMKERI